MQLFIACLVGKLSACFLKLLGFEASTWPGHLGLKIDPSLIRKLEKRLKCGSVVITGTNGKTTTANMAAHILKRAGFTVIHNSSSANLLNGLATSLILSTRFKGTYPQYGDKSVGVFEVDEAVFKKALEEFTPEVVALLNLSRDQLDRYGEVDLLMRQWRHALERLKSLGSQPRIVYSAKDKKIGQVVRGFFKSNLYPTRTFKLSARGKEPQFFYTDASFAITACSLLDVLPEKAGEALESFQPVFGRGEEIVYKGTLFKLFLAKNPKSFNANLDFWIKKADRKVVFWLALNDSIPDGRDVSWIWDIDSFLLRNLLKDRKVIVSGRRAYDLALRLKYAELNFGSVEVIPQLKKAAQAAGQAQEVVMLPTYSAMLEARKVLTGKKYD